MGQLSALFYKNWLLYKRGWIGNIIEILVPLFFILFVVMIKKIDPPVTYQEQDFITNATYSKTIDSLTTSSAFLKSCKSGEVVALAPSSNNLITEINTLITGLGYTPKLFNSQSQFQSYVRDQNYQSFSQKICYGIMVSSSSSNLYEYSLRFNISLVTDRTDGPAPSLPLTQSKGIDIDLYSRTLYKGMIGANTLVNSAILHLQTADNTKYFQNNVSPVYQEPFTQDNIYDNLASTVGIITLLPLIFIYLRQTSIMLTEKQTKIRESMYIMGMKGLKYYFSWFFRYFMVYLVIHILCTLIFSGQLKNVPPYIPFVVFILFDIVLIIQNFFIQVFLTRAKIGVIISLLFFLIQYILSFIAVNSDNPTTGVNAAISIVPHAAFVLAFRTMIYAESYQITPTFTQNLNYYVIGYAIISFVVNSLFYLLLTWYLDQVVPNQWGAKRHPLFCCYPDNQLLSVEQKQVRKRDIQSSGNYHRVHEEIEETLLAEERNNRAIEIVGLRKQFGSGEDKTVAVDNLTVSMFQGQIFALLGHNGAGKTTSISMLSGLVSPDDGYLSVFGETDIHKIREQLGVCPQHNTLYEDLTVQEHLELFASFKGLEENELKQQVRRLISDVNLEEKKDEYSKNLSGGQKRRLSVAISFAGRSKVIILDEPTSGMDASARRYIWDLLKSYKKDRIIILTTHFMDEADYLGDRIGIMGEGRLICSGSSIFLKNQYGVGYSLILTKESQKVSSEPIKQCIRKYVPELTVTNDVATNLSIQLPQSRQKAFHAMFAELDSRKSQLKFSQYGVSLTTLEEVFLNVGEELEARKKSKKIEEKALKKMEQEEFVSSQSAMVHGNIKKKMEEKNSKEDEQQEQLTIDFDHISKEEGECYQFFLHFKATFLKRLRIIRRDYKSFIFELLLPFVIILLALFLLRISFVKDYSSQTLNLNTYLSEQNPVVVPIGSDNSAFATSMQTTLNTKYGSQIGVNKDTTDTTAATYDKNYIFPKKLNQKTLLGGIFFTSGTGTSGANTLYRYNTLVNTRSPTSPLFLNTLASQTILNQVFSKPVTITAKNYPLPRTYQQLQVNNSISGFFASFIFSIALAFKFASIISFIVKQREDRAKHQQIVSGMSIAAYWTANFVYDFILYLIVAIVTIGIAKGMEISSLTEGSAFGATWLLFIFYGLSYIPFTYLIAFLFKDYGNAQAAYYFLTFVLGGMLPILTFLLRILGSGSNPIGRGLAWLLRLYPSFAFGEGLLNLGNVTFYGIYQNNSKPMSPFDLEIALACIIYLVVGFVVFYILLFVVEKLSRTESFMRCFEKSQAEVMDTHEITEEDVKMEYEKAMKADPSNYQILAKGLRKVYMIDGPRKHRVAVDNLSFGIERGQVFGLLGVNGAGKTTTFKMLAGQVTSTAGDSYFKGQRISQNVDKIREDLGYCPQFDALIENLTVYEQLQLFYDMKSLSRERREEAINNKIQELDLKEYSDKLSGTLSGGNKRKLSVAMAMIGNPRIVFLDEPSTGMDPRARRFMWKVINRVAKQMKDATVVLTTHSMEEAEALSSRLGIMVKGNFQCIGTPQHIKSKYGDGLEVEIKLKNPQKKHILEIMSSKNVEAVLIKEDKLEAFYQYYKAEPQDCLQISENGTGSYIYFSLKARKQIEAYTLAEFFQVCRLHKDVVKALQNENNDSVQELERLQTFARLKVKGKPNIGKLFEFFQKSKEGLKIQQYTIKQASVEQIFNKFAQIDEQTEYGP